MSDTNETTSKKVAKERCPHAERCYRRNPHHFREFDHPHCMYTNSEENPLTT